MGTRHRWPGSGAAVLTVCVACGPAWAGTPRLTTRGATEHTALIDADMWVERPQAVTQNEKPTELRGFSVACCDDGVCPGTSYLRVYDLDDDFRLWGTFCVASVVHAVSFSDTARDVTVNLYCLDDGKPFMLENLTRVGTRTLRRPAGANEYFSVDVDGCCEVESQSLVVELAVDECVTPDGCGQLFAGFNDGGERGPSYVLAPRCGIAEPTQLEALGFTRFDLVQVVNQVFPVFSVSLLVAAVIGSIAAAAVVLVRRRRFRS